VSADDPLNGVRSQMDAGTTGDRASVCVQFDDARTRTVKIAVFICDIRPSSYGQYGTLLAHLSFERYHYADVPGLTWCSIL